MSPETKRTLFRFVLYEEHRTLVSCLSLWCHETNLSLQLWWLWIPELLKLGGLENSNFPADRQTPEKTCTKYIWNYIHNNCSYCDSSCEPKVSLILPVYTFLGSTNKSIKYQNQQIHLVPRQTFSTSFKSDWPRHREQSTLNSFCKRY